MRGKGQDLDHSETVEAESKGDHRETDTKGTSVNFNCIYRTREKSKL